MAFIPINTAGQFGLIRDIEPHLLPANAWSELANVRVNNGSATFFKQDTALSWVPAYEDFHAGFYVPTENTKFWVVGGETGIYAYDEDILTPITKGTVTGLTGTIDPTASTAVVGVGTAFDTELAVGNYIIVSGEIRKVTFITDAENLTVSYAFTDVGNDATPDKYVPTPYSTVTERTWTGGILSGILIMNNGVDVPQYWADPSILTQMDDITAWPASTTAMVVRPFKAFLVALDVTKSGTRYPYTVKWSDAADAGAIPGSWDETDSTKLAGEFDLGQTKDYLIDCVPLGDINVIYKEGTTWGMQFIGAPLVFRFWQLFETFGAFAQNCVVEYKIGYHAVLTRDDFIIHNGQKSESAIDQKNRKNLFKLIDPTNWQMTFLSHNEKNNEVWICIPEVGESACTYAFVWNYRENTWGHRDLPNARHIPAGVINPVVDDTWDTGPDDTWDAGADEVWNEARSAPTAYQPVIFNGGANLADDSETTAASGTITAVLERTGLGVEAIKPNGSLTINLESYKFIRGIRPRLNGVAPGATITVYMGVQEHVGATISWGNAQTFTPGTDIKVDVTMSGRLMAIRFEATGYFELDGYDLDIVHDSQW